MCKKWRIGLQVTLTSNEEKVVFQHSWHQCKVDLCREVLWQLAELDILRKTIALKAKKMESCESETFCQAGKMDF
jgi:sulfur transfer protein SufE